MKGLKKEFESLKKEFEECVREFEEKFEKEFDGLKMSLRV